MRLLRTQLHCTLPWLFVLQLVLFHLLSFSLLRPVYSKDSQQGNWLQGKCKLVSFSSTQASWRCRLQQSFLSHHRSNLERKARHLFQQPISPLQHHLSPKNVAQLIGTNTLWKRDWLKSSHHSLHVLKPDYRAKERCRCLVFFQTTWITICLKVIMEFLPKDTKNKLPTSALLWHQQHVSRTPHWNIKQVYRFITNK